MKPTLKRTAPVSPSGKPTPGEGFQCPSCKRRTSIVGSVYRNNKRPCPACGTGQVAVPKPVPAVTVLPGFTADKRYAVPPDAPGLGLMAERRTLRAAGAGQGTKDLGDIPSSESETPQGQCGVSTHANQ